MARVPFSGETAVVTDARTPELEAEVSADLVERIGRGDASAEAAMCERYYARLLYFIRRRTRGDQALAEDICQQTFLKGLEKLRSREIKNPASLGAFLHGIAVNDVIGEARKTRRRATEPDLELIDRTAAEAAGPYDHLVDADVKSELLGYLSELSRQDRDVLIRFYLRDEDKESICATEGFGSAQFNNIVWRAKERLKKRLQARGDKDGHGETRRLRAVR